jgi:protein XRP2
VYVTGPASKKAILVGTDIFGLIIPVSLRFLDELAAALQVQLLAGDHFRGQPWSKSNFPPKEGSESIPDWLQRVVPAAVMDKDWEALEEYITQQEYSATGLLGFCWGGGATAKLAAGESKYRCWATCHPSFVTLEMVQQMTIPCCVLPSQREDPVVYGHIAEHLKKNEQNVFQTFADSPHGWAAARADYTRPDVKEAQNILIEFFTRHLK